MNEEVCREKTKRGTGGNVGSGERVKDKGGGRENWKRRGKDKERTRRKRESEGKRGDSRERVEEDRYKRQMMGWTEKLVNERWPSEETRRVEAECLKTFQKYANSR